MSYNLKNEGQTNIHTQDVTNMTLSLEVKKSCCGGCKGLGKCGGNKNDHLHKDEHFSEGIQDFTKKSIV